ncbi:MAG: YdcF family protein [Acidimicrobiales bacterium]|nr:YdcF family protein [Acidimicrobiales bacterium]
MLFPFKIVKKVILIVLGILVIYYIVTLFQVIMVSRVNNDVPAQAIVVMGSNVSGNSPGSDLASRLDQAIYLYNQHMAPTIIVTGYQSPGTTISQAQASLNYLVAKGINPAAIVQVGGDDSWQSLGLVNQWCQQKKIKEILLVSDPFHMDRIGNMTSTLGLSPHYAPTRKSPLGGGSVVGDFALEGGEVAVGRVFGWTFMDWLHNTFLG